MSDKQIHTKFLKLFQGFLKDIIVTMPHYSETLTNTYEGLLNRESITNLSQSSINNSNKSSKLDPQL